MNEINIPVRTQRIIVDNYSAMVAAVNEGPMGPMGLSGPPGGIGPQGPPGSATAVDDNLYNVRDYGADRTGVLDSTAAIDQTFALAAVSATPSPGIIYFPRGSYIYNGDGGAVNAAWKKIRIQGDGWGISNIILGAGKYLVRRNTKIDEIDIQDISTIGGAGLFRQDYTGNQTGLGRKRFSVQCDQFTEVAISSASVDDPYYDIFCQLQGANTDTTMGIALAGRSNQTSIAGVIKDVRVNLKMQRSVDSKIRLGMFWATVSSAGGTQDRCNIWIVPAITVSNGTLHEGMIIEGCKFGAEVLSANDRRVVFADELSGTWIGDKWPNYAADSVGYVSGIKFGTNRIATATPFNSLVYSTTPNTYGITFDEQECDTALPKHMIEYRTVPGPDHKRNVLIRGGWVATIATQGITSAGKALSNDMIFLEGTISQNNGNYGEAIDRKVEVNIGTMTLTGSLVTVTAQADGGGGTDAVKLTTPGAASGSKIFTPAVQPTSRRWLWVGFDLKAPSSGTVLTEVKVQITDVGGGTHWSKVIPVSPNAQGYARWNFLVPIRSVAGGNLRLVFSDPGVASPAGDLLVGRVRMNHGAEPLIKTITVA